jgi:eukaryotic-like serine/threonine-protein kinase
VVGETDRMIGEVLASQGKVAEATPYFDRAVKLTRVGYGDSDPRALFALLSMARQQARLGQHAEALESLDALAQQPGSGSEIPKLRWRARAYAAEARCRAGQQARARRDMDVLLHELHTARPEGGVITREAYAIRAACG